MFKKSINFFKRRHIAEEMQQYNPKLNETLKRLQRESIPFNINIYISSLQSK